MTGFLHRLSDMPPKVATRGFCFRSYWIPGSYALSIVREAQLLFKAVEKEGLQGRKGDNNWVVRHRQIPRPWNPTRASRDGSCEVALVSAGIPLIDVSLLLVREGRGRQP